MNLSQIESQWLLDHNTISSGKESKLFLMGEIKAIIDEETRKAHPLNLSIVIDRSGSMRGEKLANVQKAILDLLRRFVPEDQLSLVAYDTHVNVLISPRNVEDIRPFESAIKGIFAGHTTNLSGGWLKGCDLVQAGLIKNGVNRVLLLSDGLANVGIGNPHKLAALAREKRETGISTTTLGFGTDFNEDLLSRMAFEGGGSFHFIDNPDHARALFTEELQDLQNIVGQNLTVSFLAEDSIISARQLYKYPTYIDGGVLTFNLGDIYAQESRYQIFEITLAPMLEGKNNIGHIHVAYEEENGDTHEIQEFDFDLYVTVENASTFEPTMPSPVVEKEVLLQKSARSREVAIKFADKRSFEQAATELRDAARFIKDSKIKDDELKDCYKQLLEDAMDMELGKQRYDAHTRKVHTLKHRHSHRHQRFSDLDEGMHLRHMHTKAAIERNGPTPTAISWEDNIKDLTGVALMIGTDPSSEIVLSDPTVDSQHCRLEYENEKWYLVHLSNRGATFANSGLVVNRFRLSIGDQISIGRTIFLLKRSKITHATRQEDVESQAIQYIQAGQQNELKGKFPEAIKCYEVAISLNPNREHSRYFLHNNVGYSLNQMGNFTQAEEHCRMAISIQGNRYNAYKNLGVSLEGQGKYIEAAESYETAIKAEPNDDRAEKHLENLRRKYLFAHQTLVVVACGKAKIWKKDPDHGPCSAEEAYIGSPFKVNRKFANKYGDRWVILSAKYGFINPEFIIPEDYDVTFKKTTKNSINIETLIDQVHQLNLGSYQSILIVGGDKEYRSRIHAAFKNTHAKLHFIGAGLPLPQAIKAVSNFDLRSLENNAKKQ